MVGACVGAAVGLAVLSQHALKTPAVVGQHAMPIGKPSATHRVCAPQSDAPVGLKDGAADGCGDGTGVGFAVSPVGDTVGLAVVGNSVG